MLELAWSKDSESYAGGSVATGRVFHAGQVKGDDPDKKGYPSCPGCGLGMEQTTSSRKEGLFRNLMTKNDKAKARFEL